MAKRDKAMEQQEQRLRALERQAHLQSDADPMSPPTRTQEHRMNPGPGRGFRGGGDPARRIPPAPQPPEGRYPPNVPNHMKAVNPLMTARALERIANMDIAKPAAPRERLSQSDADASTAMQVEPSKPPPRERLSQEDQESTALVTFAPQPDTEVQEQDGAETSTAMVLADPARLASEISKRQPTEITADRPTKARMEEDLAGEVKLHAINPTEQPSPPPNNPEVLE